MDISHASVYRCGWNLQGEDPEISGKPPFCGRKDIGILGVVKEPSRPSLLQFQPYLKVDLATVEGANHPGTNLYIMGILRTLYKGDTFPVLSPNILKNAFKVRCCGTTKKFFSPGQRMPVEREGEKNS
jgi:hypothetical protein